MAKDPVCDMQVDEREAEYEGLNSLHHGQVYYFCSRECKEKFDQRPADYTVTTSEPAAPDGKTAEGYAG